ncbi:MAG: site-specific integrase [Candidatus Magnetobacterium sp. LHC-1]
MLPNIEIRHIKAVFSWAVTREYLKASPFQGYSLLKTQKTIPKFLTPAQILKVFDVIGDNKKYRLIFALYIYTGARREEIYRLQWKDIKADTVTILKTKNYTPRVIPICEKFKEILSEYQSRIGKVYTGNIDHMSKAIKEYLTLAGCGDVRPHDLRHTFASQLLMSGASMASVQVLLGHTTYATTQIYAHLSQEHLIDVVNKLPY